MCLYARENRFLMTHSQTREKISKNEPKLSNELSITSNRTRRVRDITTVIFLDGRSALYCWKGPSPRNPGPVNFVIQKQADHCPSGGRGGVCNFGLCGASLFIFLRFTFCVLGKCLGLFFPYFSFTFFVIYFLCFSLSVTQVTFYILRITICCLLKKKACVQRAGVSSFKHYIYPENMTIHDAYIVSDFYL